MRADENPLGLCDWCDFGHCDEPDGVPCTDDDCRCECGDVAVPAAKWDSRE